MNSENGGQTFSNNNPGQAQPMQTTSNLQRQAAAAIMRKKVFATYANAAKQSHADHTTHASSMKKEAVNPTINSESWKKYHSEWQKYYQNYYSEYYSNAAKSYIAKERLKDARDKEEEREIFIGKKSAEDRLRLFIRKKATDSAKKNHRHRKIIPILIGLTVVLGILFLQYNRLIITPIMAYMSPGENAASEIESVNPLISNNISSEPKLIIPKLNVNAPVVFGAPPTDTMGAMTEGVAHFRISGASAYPGEIGNFAVSGHSSGDVYDSNPYKFIFSGLERLEENDLIYVNYEGVRYTYSVVMKQVVDPSNVAALQINTDKPLITLITCTPLGTSRYRLLVTGEQISPSYEEAELSDDSSIIAPTETMPSNSPSFFEGIWNWLTGQ